MRAVQVGMFPSTLPVGPGFGSQIHLLVDRRLSIVPSRSTTVSSQIPVGCNKLILTTLCSYLPPGGNDAGARGWFREGLEDW